MNERMRPSSKERQKDRDREGSTWARFCVTMWQSGQISFYPQCTDSKECVLGFFTSFCLLSRWSVTGLFLRPVFAIQRGQVCFFLLLLLFFFPSASVQPTLTMHRSIPKGSAATVGLCESWLVAAVVAVAIWEEVNESVIFSYVLSKSKGARVLYLVWLLGGGREVG